MLIYLVVGWLCNNNLHNFTLWYDNIPKVSCKNWKKLKAQKMGSEGNSFSPTWQPHSMLSPKWATRNSKKSPSASFIRPSNQTFSTLSLSEVQQFNCSVYSLKPALVSYEALAGHRMLSASYRFLWLPISRRQTTHIFMQILKNKL